MAKTATATQSTGSKSNQHIAQKESWFAYKTANATAEMGSAIIARKRAVDIAPKLGLGPNAVIS